MVFIFIEDSEKKKDYWSDFASKIEDQINVCNRKTEGNRQKKRSAGPHIGQKNNMLEPFKVKGRPDYQPSHKEQ